ncbi:hypothetical protein L798_14436 [Zootermopsis nevadensis]|uniref:Uncharacterized protein n=1 Tax=Zootermopsis nevadensis TaxID=136037 RepID=A0A067R0F7_ZOONE|nr:hypothetical protein L798_14436 [Zootermopsis nevadensis]
MLTGAVGWWYFAFKPGIMRGTSPANVGKFTLDRVAILMKLGSGSTLVKSVFTI